MPPNWFVNKKETHLPHQLAHEKCTMPSQLHYTVGSAFVHKQPFFQPEYADNTKSEILPTFTDALILGCLENPLPYEIYKVNEVMIKDVEQCFSTFTNLSVLFCSTKISFAQTTRVAEG